MRLTLGAALAASVLMAGCGGEARSFADTLGACPASRGPTRVDLLASLGAPGAWLRVRSIEPAAGPVDAKGSAAYPGSYEVAGGDEKAVAAVRSAPSPLHMRAATARGIGEALRMGASVAVHTGAGGDARRVGYALATRGDEFAFVGECAAGLLTKPFARQFGAAAATTAASLVGKPAPAVRVALGAPPPVSVLHTGQTDPALLKSLRRASFQLARPPASWLGPYTVCSKVPQGWNDCIDLGSVTTATIEVDMYYDPKEPVVELWLADSGADVSRPLAMLGRADVGRLVRDAGITGPFRLVATPAAERADGIARFAVAPL